MKIADNGKEYNEMFRLLVGYSFINRKDLIKTSSDLFNKFAKTGNIENYNFLKKLLSLSSIKPNSFGENPLMCAAYYGKEEMLLHLINSKVFKINQSDQYGRTAIHFAAQNQHNNIMKILLENGSKIDEMLYNIILQNPNEFDKEIVTTISKPFKKFYQPGSSITKKDISTLKNNENPLLSYTLCNQIRKELKQLTTNLIKMSDHNKKITHIKNTISNLKQFSVNNNDIKIYEKYYLNEVIQSVLLGMTTVKRYSIVNKPEIDINNRRLILDTIKSTN